ncbi:MAG: hypothetical protein US90_C0032G0005 [Candidatus Shapirobacteria bacterium GW2011_GWE2_38_30]|uniref:Uncharacterized protein n=1 Tax=Candidatus Shapirobacteria bacterium GW2011_GWE2_38_30 TaxID=1618490 RepID=A0A0G0JX46_9BACT|nr:MAG: hypothetical protein US90_C0032G0005 [Candidatus Shapirobacteria bacterium GW2011_GWE2_38_30]
MSFNLQTKMTPSGDQPKAIAQMLQNLNAGHENSANKFTHLGYISQ